MVAVITWYFKPDRKLEIAAIEEVSVKDMPVRTLGAIFLVTISLWLLEAVLAPLLGINDGFSTIVAIVAVLLIVITRVLNWEEVIKSVQWEMLLLFGGGLTLGMVLDKSGLGALLAENISYFVATMPLIAFLWVIVIASIFLTEFMSNTASAALFLPVLYTLALKMHVNPILLVLPATIAATYGFMLPVGTPPNALVFSTGLVPQRDMIKAGFILNILFSMILTAFIYFLFRS
jgi:sodium-dependent dicarboxylate transporter 2/3/5